MSRPSFAIQVDGLVTLWQPAESSFMLHRILDYARHSVTLQDVDPAEAGQASALPELLPEHVRPGFRKTKGKKKKPKKKGRFKFAEESNEEEEEEEEEEVRLGPNQYPWAQVHLIEAVEEMPAPVGKPRKGSSGYAEVLALWPTDPARGEFTTCFYPARLHAIVPSAHQGVPATALVSYASDGHAEEHPVSIRTEMFGWSLPTVVKANNPAVGSARLAQIWGSFDRRRAERAAAAREQREKVRAAAEAKKRAVSEELKKEEDNEDNDEEEEEDEENEDEPADGKRRKAGKKRKRLRLVLNAGDDDEEDFKSSKNSNSHAKEDEEGEPNGKRLRLTLPLARTVRGAEAQRQREREQQQLQQNNSGKASADRAKEEKELALRRSVELPKIRTQPMLALEPLLRSVRISPPAPGSNAEDPEEKRDENPSLDNTPGAAGPESQGSIGPESHQKLGPEPSASPSKLSDAFSSSAASVSIAGGAGGADSGVLGYGPRSAFRSGLGLEQGWESLTVLPSLTVAPYVLRMHY